jgi:hypothetical protein
VRKAPDGEPRLELRRTSQHIGSGMQTPAAFVTPQASSEVQPAKAILTDSLAVTDVTTGEGGCMASRSECILPALLLTGIGIALIMVGSGWAYAFIPLPFIGCVLIAVSLFLIIFGTDKFGTAPGESSWAGSLLGRVHRKPVRYMDRDENRSGSQARECGIRNLPLSDELVESLIDKITRLERHAGARMHHRLISPLRHSSYDAISLQRSAKEIATFVGLERYTYIVSHLKQKENVGGHVDLSVPDNDVFIEVEAGALAFPDTVDVILCHEICHKWLQVRGIHGFTNRENEILTDVTCVFLGFGKIILNGCATAYEVSTPVANGVQRHREAMAVGYLNREQFAFVYRLVCAMRRIHSSQYMSGLSADAIRAIRKCDSKHAHHYSASFHESALLQTHAEHFNTWKIDIQHVLADLSKHMLYVQKGLGDTVDTFLNEAYATLESTRQELMTMLEDAHPDPALHFLLSARAQAAAAGMVAGTSSLADQADDLLGGARATGWHIRKVGQHFPAPSPPMFNVVKCPNDGTKLRLPTNSGDLMVSCPSCKYRFAYNTDSVSLDGRSRGHASPAQAERGSGQEQGFDRMVDSLIETLIRLETDAGATTHYLIMAPPAMSSVDTDSLQTAAGRIAEFIGLRGCAFTVLDAGQEVNAAKNGGPAGSDQNVCIQMEPSATASPDAAAAFLCRAICRRWLHATGLRDATDMMDEHLIDTACTFLGLGKIMLNASALASGLPAPGSDGQGGAHADEAAGCLDLEQRAFVYSVVCAMRHILRADCTEGLSAEAAAAVRESGSKYAHYCDPCCHATDAMQVISDSFNKRSVEVQYVLADLSKHAVYIREAFCRVVDDFFCQTHMSLQAIEQKLFADGQGDSASPSLQFLRATRSKSAVARMDEELRALLQAVAGMLKSTSSIAQRVSQCGPCFPAPSAAMFSVVQCPNDGAKVSLPENSGDMTATCPDCHYRFAYNTNTVQLQ